MGKLPSRPYYQAIPRVQRSTESRWLEHGRRVAEKHCHCDDQPHLSVQHTDPLRWGTNQNQHEMVKGGEMLTLVVSTIGAFTLSKYEYFRRATSTRS